MPSARDFLRECAVMERKVGKLYTLLSERFFMDTATARLFDTLSGEEELHALTLELLIRVVNTFREELVLDEKAVESARTMRDGLDKAIRMMEEGKPISPVQALELAIRIENSGIEQGAVDAFANAGDEFKKAFELLNVADKSHAERLGQRLKELKSPY